MVNCVPSEAPDNSDGPTKTCGKLFSPLTTRSLIEYTKGGLDDVSIFNVSLKSYLFVLCGYHQRG